MKGQFIVSAYQWTPVKFNQECTNILILMIVLDIGFLRSYKRRTAANTLDFIEGVLDEMPFPFQCFQTNRGLDFLRQKFKKK